MPEDEAELLIELDPVVAREYDAGLVEWGMLSEDVFNQRYPEQPFLSEEQLDTLRAAGKIGLLEQHLIDDSAGNK